MTKQWSPFAVVEPWDQVAEGYAAEASLVMEPFSLRALELAALAPGARVLDVAAGPGTLTRHAAAHARSVDAVDFSPRMVDELRRAALDGGWSNVTAAVADGQALPFADAHFDAAFSLFGLMFFPDRPKGYAELLRVLAPGGVAVVSSWAPLRDAPAMMLMFGALAAADPTFAMPSYDPASLENPEVLAEELRSAGFVDVVVHRHTHAIEFVDAASLWERMTRSSAPLVALRKRVGEEEWQRRAAIGSEYIARHVREQAPTLSTSAWLGVGRKRR